MEKEIKSFVYLGLTFTPKKRLIGRAGNFFAISKHLKDCDLTPRNWNYEEFYKVATENGAGKYDLFDVNGMTIIPAVNYLFEYI